MFNLIKMDLHRLVRTAAVWIILAFAVGAAVFSVVMTDSDIQLMKDEAQTAAEESEQRTIGIYVFADPKWADGTIEAGSVISAELRSGLLSILCVIFTAIFAGAEQKNGYIKNIAGLFPRRGNLAAAKGIVMSIWVLVMMLVFAAAAAAAGILLWGKEFYLESAAEFLKFLGAQYIFHLELSMLILLFSMLTRSTAFSMTAGILICSGILVPLYSFINKAVHDFRPQWEFDINCFVPDGNITMMGLDTAADLMRKSVLTGAVFTVILVLLSMLILQKRDIKQ